MQRGRKSFLVLEHVDSSQNGLSELAVNDFFWENPHSEEVIIIEPRIDTFSSPTTFENLENESSVENAVYSTSRGTRMIRHP